MSLNVDIFQKSIGARHTVSTLSRCGTPCSYPHIPRELQSLFAILHVVFGNTMLGCVFGRIML
jgi:hypothetical protein